jgi:sugar phosphate isomerase/epimerase
MISAGAGNDSDSPASGGLWSHDNLVAWCVVPFDAKKRAPEERAEMLEKLGFKHFAYDWREEDIPTFDAEIEVLQKRGIDLLAWWFPFDADNTTAKTTLEVFKRHNVHPQLWVMQSIPGMPKTPEEWAKLLPRGFPGPRTAQQFENLSDKDKAEFQKIVTKLISEDLPKTPEGQVQRVEKEAQRINDLARLAAPYGSKIELYNHNGWFGIEENQLAIIARLKELGVTDVGMVYNFSHSRDDLHDDSKNFSELWNKIKEHVVAVNITGMRWEGKEVYPSQGDSELNMMRIIQDSGWTGPVGLIAEKGGDAEVTLKNYMTGLDWLATELKQPGSGGPRPFPRIP